MTKTSNKSESSTPTARTQADSAAVSAESAQQQGVTQEDIYSVPVKRKGSFFILFYFLC